jgi:hypothetical protein
MLIESFQYPRNGPGMMWEAATRKTAEARRARPGTKHSLASVAWAARLCGAPLPLHDGIRSLGPMAR